MDETMSKNLPRGIRNNNPGNIEWGSPWQGLIPTSQKTDPRFAQFKSSAWGIRALVTVLITYQDKRRAKDGSRIDTVREIIERWAPSFENNTDAYVRQVAKAVCNGVTGCTGPDDPTVNVHDYKTARALVESIIRHENGQGPLKTANSWYDDATIDEGLRLAGIVKPTTSAMATPEGKAATVAVAAGGTAAVVEVVQQLTPAISQVQAVSTATEGLPTWLRVGIVVLTLVATGAAAWVLWNKRREVKAVQS